MSKLVKFNPSVWAQINYHSLLDQYEGKGLFDAAYFDALSRRRDEKWAIYWKIAAFNLLLLMALLLTASGFKTEVEQFGLKLQIDRLKELLLLIYSLVNSILALMGNDLMMMRAMLRAQLKRQVTAVPDRTWWWLQDAAERALDMRYMDSVGDFAQAHIPAVGERSKQEIWREKIVTWFLRITGLVIIVTMLGIQGFVIYDVAVSPSFHYLLSYFVCSIAVLSALTWIALAVPYWSIQKDTAVEQ